MQTINRVQKTRANSEVHISPLFPKSTLLRNLLAWRRRETQRRDERPQSVWPGIARATR